MNAEAAFIFSALKFFSGDSEHVCRLCFDSTENEEVSFLDMASVKKSYVDENISFIDMFDALGVQLEPQLPQVLCINCANTVINGYIFHKLCQYSNEKWNKVFHRLKESLMQLEEQSNPNVKSAYVMLKEKDNIIFTSRSIVQTETAAASLLNNKIRYVKKKKSRKVVMPLIKHEKNHNIDLTNERIPCPQCAKYFSTQLQVKEHAERVHQPKVIQCDKCPRMFATERMLHRHTKIHHIAAICHLCFIQFPSKNALRAHLDKHELNKCERCNKTFTNKHTYKLHLKICGRTDSKDPKFFCDLCGKGFARKNSLRTHLKTNHGYGNVLTCNWCKKKFDAISRLKMHIVKHTKERNYTCAQCGNKFVTQAALVYHTRLHTGEKPFPCDICDESFLSASRRMEHKRRKHWEPTKQCHYCNLKFVTSHELKTHVARHKNPNSKLFVSIWTSQTNTDINSTST